MAVWALGHPKELAYGFGHHRCRRLMIAGQNVLP
jgi:hypothetical protein